VVTVVPSLTDGVIVLNRFTSDDIAAHLAGAALCLVHRRHRHLG
jgi:hypothetical protein